MTIRKLLNYWFLKKREGFYLFCAFLLGGMYAAGLLMEMYASHSLAAFLQSAAFIGFLFLAILVLIHLNLHASHEFLKLFQDQSQFPKKQIEHVNSFCMTIFLGITLFSMSGLSFLLEPLWSVICRWFASIKRPASEPPPTPVEISSSNSVPPDLSALFGEPAPPPPWMKIVDLFFTAAGYLLIAIICLALLRFLCLSIWNWITKPRHFDDDEKLYLKPTLAMAAKKTGEEKIGGIFYSLSYSGKIRRYYRKQILLHQRKLKKPAPPSWASPKELENASGIQDETLHQIYEKARYSRQGGDEADWKALL